MYSDIRLPKEFTEEDRKAMEKLTPLQQQLYIQIKSKQFQNLQKPEGFDSRIHAQAGLNHSPTKQTIYSALKAKKDDAGHYPAGMPSYLTGLQNSMPNHSMHPTPSREKVGSMGMTDHEKYEFMKYGLGESFSYMR